MKKIISLAIALLMLFSVATIFTATSTAADYYCTKTLEELKILFPDGRYWNHVGLSSWDMTTTTDKPCTQSHSHGKCSYSGSCGCNSYNGIAIQCMGFAYALQSIAFNGFDGYYASENRNYSSAMSNLKAGDVIRYSIGSSRHSIFVTKVDGDTIYFMDCNGSGGGCGIRHDQTITKTALKSRFIYTTSAPCELISNSANRINLFETAVVTAKSGLVIRSRPDINSSKVGSFKYNDTINVCHFPIPDSSGYSWKRLLNGAGWVCNSYISIINGNTSVSGTYKIQNESGKYLTYVSKPANDVNIVMMDDLAGTSSADVQLWNFTLLGARSDTGAAIYRIKPKLDSNYSLDCDEYNYKLLHLWKNYDIGAQQWYIEVRTDGSLRILNAATGYALDVEGNRNANYNEVITYPSNDTNAQRFYLVNS